MWIEILGLNDVQELLSRLSTMLDTFVEDNWWVDRDTLRAKLPVNQYGVCSANIPHLASYPTSTADDLSATDVNTTWPAGGAWFFVKPGLRASGK